MQCIAKLFGYVAYYQHIYVLLTQINDTYDNPLTHPTRKNYFKSPFRLDKVTQTIRKIP